MTLLETPPEVETAALAAPEHETAKPKKPRLDARRRVVSIALIALVAVVVGWLAFALFEGPVAHAWSRTRQNQLGPEFLASRPHGAPGTGVAVLQIPRLGTDVVVAQGDSPQQLRGGPGHRIGTPLPGDLGNSVIVGHRTGWGGAFSDADQVKTGDFIVVQTHQGDALPNGVFKVISVQRTTGSDVTPFGGATDRRLTIVTGTGGQFSDGRLVIVAVSGTVGKALPPGADVSASTGAGSRLWNPEMLLAVVAFAGAVLIALVIRRRYHLAIVVTAIVPLVLLGVLALFLNLDLFLPALR